MLTDAAASGIPDDEDQAVPFKVECNAAVDTIAAVEVLVSELARCLAELGIGGLAKEGGAF